MLSIFSCACWPPVSSLEKCLFRSLPIFQSGCLGFFLLLSCMTCLYILEIKPLSDESFATIFSHAVGCLFFFFMVSFAMQKLVILSIFSITALSILIILALFVFLFLRPHWQHMEIPRPGVESELHLRPTLHLRQHWILNPLSEARD